MRKLQISNRTTRTLLLATIFFMTLCLSGLVKAHAEAATSVNYKMQKKTITYKDGDKIRGIVSYQYPVIEGDSVQIAELNQMMEDTANAFMANDAAKSIKEYTQQAIKNKAFTDDKEQYYMKTTCKVTYNKDNIFSIHLKEMWYAGGVYNQSDYGYTNNIKTGKALNPVEAIGGTSKQVKNKVLKSAKAYFKKNYSESFDYLWENASASLNSYDVMKYKYYLVPGKARICFESYELNCGSDFQEFSVASKYK